MKKYLLVSVLLVNLLSNITGISMEEYKNDYLYSDQNKLLTIDDNCNFIFDKLDAIIQVNLDAYAEALRNNEPQKTFLIGNNLINFYLPKLNEFEPLEKFSNFHIKHLLSRNDLDAKVKIQVFLELAEKFDQFKEFQKGVSVLETANSVARKSGDLALLHKVNQELLEMCYINGDNFKLNILYTEILPQLSLKNTFETKNEIENYWKIYKFYVKNKAKKGSVDESILMFRDRMNGKIPENVEIELALLDIKSRYSNKPFLSESELELIFQRILAISDKREQKRLLKEFYLTFFHQDIATFSKPFLQRISSSCFSNLPEYPNYIKSVLEHDLVEIFTYLNDSEKIRNIFNSHIQANPEPLFTNKEYNHLGVLEAIDRIEESKFNAIEKDLINQMDNQFNTFCTTILGFLFVSAVSILFFLYVYRGIIVKNKRLKTKIKQKDIEIHVKDTTIKLFYEKISNSFLTSLKKIEENIIVLNNDILGEEEQNGIVQDNIASIMNLKNQIADYSYFLDSEAEESLDAFQPIGTAFDEALNSFDEELFEIEVLNSLPNFKFDKSDFVTLFQQYLSFVMSQNTGKKKIVIDTILVEDSMVISLRDNTPSEDEDYLENTIENQELGDKSSLNLMILNKIVEKYDGSINLDNESKSIDISFPIALECTLKVNELATVVA